MKESEKGKGSHLLAFFWIHLAIQITLFNILTTGASQLSAENKTLISGFIAVISVNLVIGFYICMAMKESTTSNAPQPDPRFLAEAKASINQSETVASSSTGIDQTSGKDIDQTKGKMEWESGLFYINFFLSFSLFFLLVCLGKQYYFLINKCCASGLMARNSCSFLRADAHKRSFGSDTCISKVKESCYLFIVIFIVD